MLGYAIVGITSFVCFGLVLVAYSCCVASSRCSREEEAIFLDEYLRKN